MQAEFSCKPKAIANLFDIAEVQPKMESLQSPKRTCSCLGKAQPKMEEFQSNSKSSLLEFAIAEKLCQREHEQIHLFIAEKLSK